MTHPLDPTPQVKYFPALHHKFDGHGSSLNLVQLQLLGPNSIFKLRVMDRAAPTYLSLLEDAKNFKSLLHVT